MLPDHSNKEEHNRCLEEKAGLRIFDNQHMWLGHVTMIAFSGISPAPRLNRMTAGGEFEYIRALWEDCMPQRPVPSLTIVVGCAAFLFLASTATQIANRTGMAFEQNPQAADTATRTIIDRFNDAFNRHDPEVMASLLTDDTVFEDTSTRWETDGRKGCGGCILARVVQAQSRCSI